MISKTDNKIKKKQFRLRGKKLFLTYSQLNLDNLKNVQKLIFEQLKNKVPKIIQYVIAEEKHEDGGTHYHVYLEFNQKVELYGSNCLDLIFNEKNYHGKYETVRKKDSTIRYITKFNNFIAEPELPFLDGELFLNFKEYLVKLHEKGGLTAVKKHLIANPSLMIKGGANTLKNLEKLDKLKIEQILEDREKETILPIETFNIPTELEEWFEAGAVETLIINGLSGIGKTEMIKSFLNSKGIEYLLIRNIHGLREYNPQKHQAILLDDISFEKELSNEEFIAITDTANPGDIRVIKDSIRIPAYTKRIITTNRIEEIIKHIWKNKAILTRIFILNLQESLFKEKIEIDIHIKIRGKDREEKVFENNTNILKKLLSTNLNNNFQNFITH